ncbi:MAG: ribosome maturation factor RimM [Lachnospiraceae bacterium]|nr:ribosome maturation factor RimM [Lachnospiraceae bacterium]
MDNRLRVGVIASPHGLKGEVKVFPTTDNASRFKKLKAVMMDNGSEFVKLAITGLKFSGKFVVLKFSGFERIEDAQKCKGFGLWIDREDAVKLAKNEFFIADLIGMQVIDEDSKELGEIKDVIQTGANDVYVVKQKEGKDLLFPAIKECILDINAEKRIIRVHVMEGLLEC